RGCRLPRRGQDDQAHAGGRQGVGDREQGTGNREQPATACCFGFRGGGIGGRGSLSWLGLVRREPQGVRRRVSPPGLNVSPTPPAAPSSPGPPWCRSASPRWRW